MFLKRLLQGRPTVERRVHCAHYQGAERRSGNDRRKVQNRRNFHFFHSRDAKSDRRGGADRRTAV